MAEQHEEPWGCCPKPRLASAESSRWPRLPPSAEAFDAAACMKKGGSMSMVKRRSSKAAPAAAVSTRASVDSHLSTRMIVSAVDMTRCLKQRYECQHGAPRVTAPRKGQHTHVAPDRGRRTKAGGGGALRDRYALMRDCFVHCSSPPETCAGRAAARHGAGSVPCSTRSRAPRPATCATHCGGRAQSHHGRRRRQAHRPGHAHQWAACVAGDGLDACRKGDRDPSHGLTRGAR